MGPHRIIVACPIIVALLIPATAASAQYRMPDRYQARPLTLPRSVLRPDLGLRFTSEYEPPPSDRRHNTLDFWLGLGAGLTPDFELGALIAPLRLAPRFDYLNPEIYVRYRFVRGQAEVGVEGRVELPVDSRGSATIGLPLLIHAGDVVRLDFGAFLQTDFMDELVLHFPFALAIQASMPVFFGFETGASVWLEPDRNAVVPLGFFLGYTIIGRGDPAVDIRVGFRLPDVERGFDLWEATLGFTFFLYL